MDVRLFLNGMLPPSERFAKSIAKDKSISQQDKDILYKLTEDCLKDKGRYKIEQGLKTLAPIIVNYSHQGEALPFLIKQVMFCLIVNYIKHHEKKGDQWTQAEALKILKQYDVNKTMHHFTTRMVYTPRMYVQEIPKPLTNYMGQKHGSLGMAIKNLVWQAGDYDIFCDMFGGSGVVTMFVDKLPGKDYVYNELNICVCNLMRVLANDNLHRQLIEELKVLQSYIKKGGKPYGNMELGTALLNARDIAKKKEAQSTDMGIIGVGFDNYEARGFEVFELAIRVYTDLLGRTDDINIQFGKSIYNKDKLLALFAVDMPNNDDIRTSSAWLEIVSTFLYNRDLFHEYIKQYGDKSKFAPYMAEYRIPSYKLPSYDSFSERQKLTREEFLQYRKKARAYAYVSYFTNLLNKPQITSTNQVEYAVAELFIQYFLQYNTENGSVLSKIRTDTERLNSFINCSFSGEIKKVHMRLKGVKVKQLDFRKILEDYCEPKKVIYYADPPYLGTKDYDKETIGVKKFTKEDMKCLTKELVESGGKFIFSCRAVLSGVSKTRKIKETNNNIYQCIYKVFEDYQKGQKKKCYVLAIETDETNIIDGEHRNKLDAKIRNSTSVEIMITNYKIHSFILENYDKVIFKVYSLDEFIDIWKANAII